MRRILWILLAASSLSTLPGCAWDYRESILQSIYHSFGEGYSADRFSDFDTRYRQQSQLAEEYYRDHPQ
jgi:hypothetical protein